MSEKAHRAREAADRLRAAFAGASDPELETLLGLEPPPGWAGVSGDLARGAAVLAGRRPTFGAIRDIAAPRVTVRTVARWLDPSEDAFMPWGAWCALLRLAQARAALAAETASAA